MISTNIYGQRFHEKQQQPKYPKKTKQKIDKTVPNEDNG